MTWGEADKSAHALEQQVAAEYARRGDELGWRLLYSPLSALHEAEVAFLGLNPGGSAPDIQCDGLSTPGGSAYVTESWAGYPPGQSPLQRQVRMVFDRLQVSPETVLAGNLVPFRSPNWQALRDPAGALRFGQELWSDFLRSERLKVVVAMGGAVFHRLHALLGDGDMVKVPVGWGRVAGRIVQTESGVVLLGLPHLSRFAIMSRPRSRAAVDQLFDLSR